MVKAMHRAGNEVILDVVYNHSAEGGVDGPTLSFRGLENRIVLHPGIGRRAIRGLQRLREHPERQPRDRAAHDPRQPAALGPAHARGRIPFRPRVDSFAGRARRSVDVAAVLWEIDSDPVLAGTKLIAEAWDAAGPLPGRPLRREFLEGMERRFRDDVRGFWKGDSGEVRRVAARIWGSPDIYEQEEREPDKV
jgi:glycogen operon protein